ncbi:MAG: GerAB/ArcD/ProY family transporter [Acetivibrionales bacterium]
MNREIIFGKWEGISTVVLAICTQIFLNMPRVVAEAAGTAGWILTAYVSIIALVLFTFITRLYSRFEGMDILEISEFAGGKALKIIAGTIIFLYLIFDVSIVLREFSENMKIISLSVSPISFVMLFFLAGMITGAYAGIEGIVRVAAIAVPLIIVGYIIIAVGVLQFNDFSRIMPWFGLGTDKIFLEGLGKISIFSGIIVIFFIAPFLKINRNFKRVGYIGLLMSALFLILSALVYLIIFPYPSATENFLPIYQLARTINYGRFFQRVESVFLFLWAIAALLYLTLSFFFILYVFAETFNIKYYKPLIIPFSIIVFTLSIIPPNLLTAIELDTKYLMNYAWIVAFGLTILILLMAGFKKNRAIKERNRNERD